MTITFGSIETVLVIILLCLVALFRLGELGMRWVEYRLRRKDLWTRKP